jgi:hypothetical protein
VFGILVARHPDSDADQHKGEERSEVGHVIGDSPGSSAPRRIPTSPSCSKVSLLKSQLEFLCVNFVAEEFLGFGNFAVPLGLHFLTHCQNVWSPFYLERMAAFPTHQEDVLAKRGPLAAARK